VESFIEEDGHSDSHSIAYPFLQGRCLFLASRFADLLPQDVRGQYLDAAVQVIESNETEVPFKVSAVKSIKQSVNRLLLQHHVC